MLLKKKNMSKYTIDNIKIFTDSYKGISAKNNSNEENSD